MPAAAFSPIALTAATPAQLDAYLAASGDRNPVHTDAALAARIGLRDVPVPGLMTMAMLEAALTRWVDSDRIGEFSLTFVAPVFPGDALTATARPAARETTARGERLTLRITLAGPERKIVAIGAAVIEPEDLGEPT